MDENSGSEIIDFDDEYSENENQQENNNQNEIENENDNEKDNENDNENENEKILPNQNKKTESDINEQIGQSKHNYEQQVEEQNQEMMAPEEEEQIENASEENIIYNPKIKELNEIDINNKEAIINLLMQDDLITKKQQKNDTIKQKNKNKFAYIESTMKDNNTKKNSYGRVGYQIESNEGDPQFVKDINVAAYLLKPQIQEENQDIAKLLFDDLAPSPNNKKILTRSQIGEKVKKTLEKKRKNLEKIEAKMYEEQKSQETFSPLINHRKKDGNRRNLNSFLKDQNDFQKKVELKKQNLILQNESDNKNKNIGRPQVDKISEELVKKMSNGDEPAYMRLYNKRMNNEKLKEIEEKRNLLEKEKEKKRKEKENELKKNNPYKHIKSKINILKKSPSQVGSNLIKDKDKDLLDRNNNNRIKVPFNRNAKSVNKRDKNESYIIRNQNKKLFDYKDLPTNKMLWNKFIKNFDEALINLNENYNNIYVSNNSNNSNETNFEELNESQYHKLLYNLSMVTYPPDTKDKDIKNEENKIKDDIKEENNKQNEIEPEIIIENMLKVDENKLINDSFNLLKLDQEKAKIIDIKNFLIFVLDNQNYDLYQQYKINHEQELKDLFPLDKYKKEDIPELILKKQNEELLSNIDKSNKKNNKYFSISKDNKIIFTLDKSPNIKKDFSMFGLNYRNKRKKGKEEKLLNIIKEKYPFKPTINMKSEKLYKKYKDKIYPIQNDTVNSNSNSQIKKLNNMEYIDRILLLDKKRIAENQKIKEEMQKKEIKECTFKPKINQTYPVMVRTNKEDNQNQNPYANDNNKIIKKNIVKSKNKFEELYEKGKKILQSKKDKPREEIELEQQREECTFQPNIKNNDLKIPKTNFNNDIYNEKEYKYLYERLRHGRLERMVKDSNNDRYGLNNELKQFVKDNKEFNFIQNQAYFEPNDAFYYNNNQIEYENNFNNKEGENIEKQNNINMQRDDSNNNSNNLENQQNNQEEENNENEGDPNRKDEIPLLIIDVNIRQGVKKKIYVYEGDTPEELADKFAKEHNLEIETKNKLQSLIHSHMVRLLTRIEEENQSISEKSQNNHNQKNN